MMGANFNFGAIMNFPAKDGGKLGLSSVQTEEYNLPVYLTCIKVFREDCPPEIKENDTNKDHATMVGFIRRDEYVEGSWIYNEDLYCSFKYRMVTVS